MSPARTFADKVGVDLATRFRLDQLVFRPNVRANYSSFMTPGLTGLRVLWRDRRSKTNGSPTTKVTGSA
jgi:hypothetical protein